MRNTIELQEAQQMYAESSGHPEPDNVQPRTIIAWITRNYVDVDVAVGQ